MVGLNASKLMYYSSGVFNDWTCNEQINTTWTAVGYGKAEDTLYWIVQAKWGTTYGEQGYVRLARREEDGVGICGITEFAAYPKD